MFQLSCAKYSPLDSEKMILSDTLNIRSNLPIKETDAAEISFIQQQIHVHQCDIDEQSLCLDDISNELFTETNAAYHYNDNST